MTSRFDRNTAADPASLARPEISCRSGPKRLMACSMPVFNNSTISTMNKGRISRAVCESDSPNQKAAGKSTIPSRISSRKAASDCHVALMPWTENRTAFRIREMPKVGWMDICVVIASQKQFKVIPLTLYVITDIYSYWSSKMISRINSTNLWKSFYWIWLSISICFGYKYFLLCLELVLPIFWFKWCWW